MCRTSKRPSKKFPQNAKLRNLTSIVPDPPKVVNLHIRRGFVINPKKEESN